MLQSIRKITRGAGAWLFVAAVALPLSFFGFSWISTDGGNERVANINGEPIKRRELVRRTYIEQQRELIRQGEFADPDSLDQEKLRNRALQILLNNALIRQEAEARDLNVSNASLDGVIVEEFRRDDGSFSQDFYERVLLQNGYTPGYYKKEVRGRMLRRHLLSFFNTDFLTGNQLQRLYPLYSQKRDVAYVRFNVAEAEEQIIPEEQEMRQRYEEDPSRYFSEERVTLDYAVIRRADFYQAPDEQILLDYYQTEIDQLMKIRVISHILLAWHSGYSDEEATGKLKELRRRFLDGEGFADLAREYSEDPGTKMLGGYLGEANMGALGQGNVVISRWPTKFRNAMRLLERGEISPPVKTEAGWHLIYRENLPVPPTYEQRRTALLQEVRHANAQDDYFNYLPEISDALPTATDLQSLPWRNSEEIITEGPFTRKEAQGYFKRQNLLALIFSERFLSGGRPVLFPWSDEESLVIYPREHSVARELTYEEARERISAALRTEKAKQAVQDIARQWRRRAQAGQSLAALAAADGRELFEYSELERRDSEAPKRVLEAAFSMPYPEDQKPQYQIINWGDEGAALLELRAVRQAEQGAPQAAEEREEFTDVEERMRGQLAAQLFLNTLQLRTIVSDVDLD